MWKHAVLVYSALSLSTGIIAICRMWKSFKNESPGTKSHFCTERPRHPTASLGISEKSLMPVSPKKARRAQVPPAVAFGYLSSGTKTSTARNLAGAVAELRHVDKCSIVSKLTFVLPELRSSESLSHPILSIKLVP